MKCSFLSFVSLFVSVSFCCGGVVCRHEDLNGDGVAEIILENECLRVGLTTGEPNGELLAKGYPDGNPYFYGKRFLWGGWIWELVFKPTGRQWLVNYDSGWQRWHGMPDSMEEAIPMGEAGGGQIWGMIPGVGIGVGKGRMLMWSMRDMQYSPWTVECQSFQDGTWKNARTGCASAWRLTFRNVIQGVNGYGCSYEKTVVLREESSRLEIRRILKNTGTKDFHTVWFTHGFLGQGKNGLPDKDCWSTVPRLSGGKLVDTEPCRWMGPPSPSYWGSLSGRDVAESWCASGNRSTRDIFVESVDRPVDYYRFWTFVTAYSCEPFLAIDLKPGEDYVWNSDCVAGNGLKEIKAKGRDALLDWSVKRGTSTAELEFSVLPLTSGKGRIQVRGSLSMAGKNSLAVDLSSEVVEVGPARPVRLKRELPLDWVDGIASVSLTVSCVSGDGERTELVAVSDQRRLRVRPRVEVSEDADGALAVVIGGLVKTQNGWEKSVAALYWLPVLEACGFDVQLVPDYAEDGMIDWEHLALAVSVGRTMSPITHARMKEFVRGGGGFIQAGPVDYQRYADDSDLLPITDAYTEISVTGMTPRDGTREFKVVDDYRYHLAGGSRHPVLQGLPLHPDSHQNIGTFQAVTPTAEAQVLAWLVPGGPKLGTKRYPGILARNYGKGKVLMTAFPIAWGQPDYFVVWSRLGEYHTKLLQQMGLWAKGRKVPWEQACQPVEKLEKDCYDWHERHRKTCEAVKRDSYDIVLIGDSITHFWEKLYGPKCWQELFKGRKVLNLGFGWDRTGNVLWRLNHGELEGQTPKACVIHIGTNNFSKTSHYVGDDAAGVFAGIQAVVRKVRQLSPSTKVVLMEVFPRGQEGAYHQVQIDRLNRLLEAWVQWDRGLVLLDIGAQLRDANGRRDGSLYRDGVHLNEKGYRIWAEALERVFESLKL